MGVAPENLQDYAEAQAHTEQQETPKCAETQGHQPDDSGNDQESARED